MEAELVEKRNGRFAAVLLSATIQSSNLQFWSQTCPDRFRISDWKYC